MIQAKIIPGLISGGVSLPASKSYSQRLLALALLHRGSTKISGLGKSDDEETALAILQDSGAIIKSAEEGVVEVVSDGRPNPKRDIHCGESALSLRMFAPILALSENEFVMHGRGTLLKRPVKKMEEYFPGLGVAVSTSDGFLPVKLKGPLQPGDISIGGTESSQHISGILMAVSASCSSPVKISVVDAVSKPYIDLTVQLMQKFGYKVESDGHSSYTLFPYSGTSREISCLVESDWSHAAFWLVAGALAGNIELKGLNMDSMQGDRIILKVLQDAGASFQILSNDSIRINHSCSLSSFEFDATHYPDLFPPLAVLAASVKGTSVIHGVHRLKHKESDRARQLMYMLSGMGIKSSISNDALMIEGGRLRGAIVDSGHDHRIVMAAAVAGLVANDPVIIRHAGAVSKSYPAFFDDLRALGAVVSLSSETFQA